MHHARTLKHHESPYDMTSALPELELNRARDDCEALLIVRDAKLRHMRAQFGDFFDVSVPDCCVECSITEYRVFCRLGRWLCAAPSDACGINRPFSTMHD